MVPGESVAPLIECPHKQRLHSFASLLERLQPQRLSSCIGARCSKKLCNSFPPRLRSGRFRGTGRISQDREEERMGLFTRTGVVLGIVCVSSPAWAQLYSITSTGQLFTVNTSNAATTFVGNTGIPNPGSLEFRAADGFLYSMEIGGVPGFWRINPATAAATLVGNPGVFIFEGALQFAPDGTLFGTSRDSAFNPQLFTVNLAN